MSSAVARTVGGLEELDDEIKAERARSGKGEATLVPLDLTDMAGIDRLGGAIHDRWKKLDILVANAAMLGVISPIGHVEAKIFDKVMAVNVTGTWRLIRSVDPLLRFSDAGRAIVVTSSLAHSARAFWAPYAASKAAVETLARSWADETKNLPLRVNAFDPGRDAHRHARAGDAGRKPRDACRIRPKSAANIMPLVEPRADGNRAYLPGQDRQLPVLSHAGVAGARFGARSDLPMSISGATVRRDAQPAGSASRRRRLGMLVGPGQVVRNVDAPASGLDRRQHVGLQRIADHHALSGPSPCRLNMRS